MDQQFLTTAQHVTLTMVTVPPERAGLRDTDSVATRPLERRGQRSSFKSWGMRTGGLAQHVTLSDGEVRSG